MNNNKFDIIFEDGPIARFYISAFANNQNLNSIIIPVKNYIFKDYYLYKNFLVNNSNALKHLKKKYSELISLSMSKTLNLNKFDLKKIYNFKNCFLKDKVVYIKSESLDSPEILNYLNKLGNSLILNTSKKKLTNLIKSNKNILHIHPGFLPEYKGYDCSLYSLYNNNKLGVSSFFMNKDLDSGKIIMREEILNVRFKNIFNRDVSVNEIYNIWYAFAEPQLRVSHLSKILNKEIKPNKKLLNNTNIPLYKKILDRDKYISKIFNI